MHIMYAPRMVDTLYKKLLALYPREFRERLGESMEQTFHDLCNEPKRGAAPRFFVLSIFTETAIGIVREHLLLLIEGDIMKNILANPRSAAIISFILALLLGLIFVAFMFDIEQLVKPFNALLTINGSDVNLMGRLVLIGGLLLLPLAFVLNLRPMLKREGPEGKRRLHTANLIVGGIILLLITVSWGGLILKSIYCAMGIRCD